MNTNAHECPACKFGLPTYKVSFKTVYTVRFEDGETVVFETELAAKESVDAFYKHAKEVGLRRFTIPSIKSATLTIKEEEE